MIVITLGLVGIGWSAMAQPINMDNAYEAKKIDASDLEFTTSHGEEKMQDKIRVVDDVELYDDYGTVRVVKPKHLDKVRQALDGPQSYEASIGRGNVPLPEDEDERVGIISEDVIKEMLGDVRIYIDICLLDSGAGRDNRTLRITDSSTGINHDIEVHRVEPVQLSLTCGKKYRYASKSLMFLDPEVDSNLELSLFDKLPLGYSTKSDILNQKRDLRDLIIKHLIKHRLCRKDDMSLCEEGGDSIEITAEKIAQYGKSLHLKIWDESPIKLPDDIH
jgi:hypothetical protein